MMEEGIYRDMENWNRNFKGRTLGLEKGNQWRQEAWKKNLQGLGSKGGFGGIMGWGTGEGPCGGRVRRKEQGRSLAGWEGLKHQKMGL